MDRIIAAILSVLMSSQRLSNLVRLVNYYVIFESSRRKAKHIPPSGCICKTDTAPSLAAQYFDDFNQASFYTSNFVVAKNVAMALRTIAKARLVSSLTQQARRLQSTNLPPVFNEPVVEYFPGTEERAKLLEACHEVKSNTVDVPCVVNGEAILTGDVVPQLMPSDHGTVIANVHQATPEIIRDAIKGALAAQAQWERTPFENRAAVFLRAADLLSTEFRYKALATTMMGQGKTAQQAEIDAVAEAADFFRFGVHYANEILAQQPEHHAQHVWNRLDYRALEGFVAAVPPFNFTAIGANLGSCPAIMGNVILWKPSNTAALSNHVIFEILREAGMPDGVMQFVPSDGPTFGNTCLADPNLAAINFTGSTKTFDLLWRQVGDNLSKYKTYPRMIGECGGKNYHWVHPSADLNNVIHGTIRSAFEYQGQKCSACSRVYLPESLWDEFQSTMLKEMADIKMGQPDDFEAFMTAVIDKTSFDKITGYLDHAKQSDEFEVLSGGNADDSKGYFVEPTLIRTSNPHSKLMEEEIFGPVVTAYVYKDDEWESTLDLVNNTSPYGLTGSVYAKDRYVITKALEALRHTAGNIYINAKSTGSVVGQQPFGGARRSGTNDKAGASNYLLRFTSIQSAKECLTNVDDWRYAHMSNE
eukprot:TRINITY_DN6901_c0_g1_i1.p1 TRINITY_DN6901_c0_g1~~TRINITY_DN6901_c0_g1_i1.p1  ORF type:complete len:645 (+),score=187.75 TRINITY_DN6901_c0_g1_i1:69-2003(+)